MATINEYRTKSTADLFIARENNRWLHECFMFQDNKGWKAEWKKKLNQFTSEIKKINKVLEERGKLK